MHGFSTRTAKAAGLGRGSGNQGIGFPRIYDLLILALTRGRERQYRRAVLELAELAPGHRVLDVGCGTGSQAIMASRQVGSGGSVTGVDISEPMLAVARRKTRRAGADVEFHKADAAELPFADGGFDVVMVTTVLHMMPNDRQRDSLREMSRVLCRGGRLVLIDYAGNVSGRSHLSARHGRHGQFDLNALWGMLVEEGFTAVEGGPLGWLSLPLPPGDEDLIRGLQRHHRSGLGPLDSALDSGDDRARPILTQTRNPAQATLPISFSSNSASLSCSSRVRPDST